MYFGLSHCGRFVQWSFLAVAPLVAAIASGRQAGTAIRWTMSVARIQAGDPAGQFAASVLGGWLTVAGGREQAIRIKEALMGLGLRAQYQASVYGFSEFVTRRELDRFLA